MQVTRLDVEGFVARAGGFLEAREAEHNLILGLSGRLLLNPHVYGDADPYFAVVEDGARVVTAAMRTPPYNLILAEADDPSASAALVADVHAATPDLPGVVGPAAGIAAFVSAWRPLTGDGAERVMSQGIYEAADVIEPKPVAGRMRALGDEDHAVALGWMQGFFDEVMPPGGPETPAGVLERKAEDPDGDFVLWDDGAPVSISGHGNATPRGIRIGPVYTPPELRGRGYASALVAAQTAQLLAGGREFCFLYTDLANPTSNAIYQRIGYRQVTEVEMWRFVR